MYSQGNPNLVIDTLIGIMKERKYTDKSIPDTIKVIIQKDYWQTRTPEMPIPQTRTYKTFKEFCEANRPWGLGTNFDVLLKICSRRPEVLSLIDGVTNCDARFKEGGKPNPLGVNQYAKVDGIDNVNTIQKEQQAGTGNSKTQAIRRLKKERPDLLKKFERGEISAHSAMVKAGFRRKKIQIDVGIDYVENVVKTLKKNCTEEFINTLKSLL